MTETMGTERLQDFQVVFSSTTYSKLEAAQKQQLEFDSSFLTHVCVVFKNFESRVIIVLQTTVTQTNDLKYAGRDRHRTPILKAIYQLVGARKTGPPS